MTLSAKSSLRDLHTDFVSWQQIQVAKKLPFCSLRAQKHGTKMVVLKTKAANNNFSKQNKTKKGKGVRIQTAKESCAFERNSYFSKVRIIHMKKYCSAIKGML